MKTRTLVACLLVLICPVLAFAQKTPAPKASVVHRDKTVDFAKFKTYSYEKGQPAIRQDVDARIFATIEAQMAALGLTKAMSGPGDVIVTYYSVTRTDVDLATFDKNQPATGKLRTPAQTFSVGTLVVDLKLGESRASAWRAKVEGALKGDAAAQLDSIDKAVVAAIDLYPTRTGKK